MKTPVVLIIFKRPNTTKKVFEAIRQAKPSKLFVIADGPRIERSDELKKCEDTRAVIEQIDWDCEVFKNYSEINLGCGKRVSSGLDWVFEQVEEAIILEDDCVPHTTFFPFCEELLDKYRYDNRIASISGQNVQFGRKRTNYSYYFSRYNHCWGWATWRRAWQHFDIYMKLWTEIQEGSFLNDILIEKQAVDYWTRRFDSTFYGLLSTNWDYQWTFACWVQSSLGIISNVNLISNIGFDSDSTHVTANQKKRYENLQTEAIDFPIKHPTFIVRDSLADTFTQKTLFRESRLQVLKQQFKKIFRKSII